MRQNIKILSVCTAALLSGLASGAIAGDKHRASDVSVATYGATLSEAGKAALRTNRAYTAPVATRQSYQVAPAPAGAVAANSGALVVNSAAVYNASLVQNDADRLRRLQEENAKLRSRNEQLVRTSTVAAAAITLRTYHRTQNQVNVTLGY